MNRVVLGNRSGVFDCLYYNVPTRGLYIVDPSLNPLNYQVGDVLEIYGMSDGITKTVTVSVAGSVVGENILIAVSSQITLNDTVMAQTESNNEFAIGESKTNRQELNPRTKIVARRLRAVCFKIR